MSLDYLQAIGQTFKYLRITQRLSLRDLADRLGVSHTFIANIEKGDVQPSVSILEKYEKHFQLTFTFDEDTFISLYQILNEVFDSILFHNFSELVSQREALVSHQEVMTKAGLSFYWELALFIIDAHDYQAVLEIRPEKAAELEKFNDDLNPFLNFVFTISIAIYERYHFHLSKAKTRLEAMLENYLNPHHKAIVKDRLSDLYYHTFDRSKAIKYASEAIQTYQTFHNVNRSILSEIKKNLYGKRQHQSEVDLPYQGFIEQAKIYKLNEVIHDISYVWALRIFRFHKYEEARNILETLDLSYPPFYHYYVIILFGSKDYDRLNHFLKTQPLKESSIKVFRPAIEYVKAVLENAADEVLEQHLIEYLNLAIKEELYGETRWAETLFNDFYMERRRYKDATLLKERLIKLILT